MTPLHLDLGKRRIAQRSVELACKAGALPTELRPRSPNSKDKSVKSHIGGDEQSMSRANPGLPTGHRGK